MTEKELLRIYSAAYDHLDRKNIYEVRNLARAFGVVRVTSTRKHDLIVYLIRLAAGLEELPPRSRRGARVKADKASDASIAEVRRIIEDCKTSAPYPDFREEEGMEFHDSADRAFGYRDECMVGLLELAPSGQGRLYTQEGSPEPVVPERLIREYGLREGDVVSGYVIPGKGTAPEIAQIAAVNGYPPVFSERRRFEDFPAAYPNEKLCFGACGSAVLKAADLICPMGKGQRALIVSPAGAGKTTFVREAARSVAATSGAQIHFVLLGQRPEERQELLEAVPSASVTDAPFDSSASRCVRAARLAIEHAKRVAEEGKDAVVFIDSLAALIQALASGTQEGNAQAALLAVKKMFAAARRLEGGGSLTILATLPEDAQIADACRELSAAANAVVYLSAEIAASGIIPAVDFTRSFSRRADALDGAGGKARADALLALAREGGTARVLKELEKETGAEESAHKEG